MEEEWFCPVCGYKSAAYNGIRIHFTRSHLNDECPVCGKKFKSVIMHLERMSDCDLMHAICYALVARNSGKSSERMWWYRECRDLAYEMLKISKLTEFEKCVNKTKLTEVLTC